MATGYSKARRLLARRNPILRDVMREHILLDDIPLHIIDTAGLRDTEDHIERMGIARSWAEIERADVDLLDATHAPATSSDTKRW